MAKVQPIETLNIDNVSFKVSDLSPAVQSLVAVYNDWNQDLADAQSRLAQVQAALNGLSTQILSQIKKDQDEAAAAAAAAAPAETAEASDGTVVN